MKILLITPPFTQLNSPYPATAFLKQFLAGKGEKVNQKDLGLDLFLSIFSKNGLERVFVHSRDNKEKLDRQCRKIESASRRYINCIESVVSFLKTRESGLAYLICRDGFLPVGKRLSQAVDLEWAFGTTGVIDKACYLSTLFLEEISDFIRKRIIPDFGFSRYAERLALSATFFEPIHQALQQNNSFLDEIISESIHRYLDQEQPNLVGFTIPFPGCLFGALKSCMVIKQRDTSIKTVLGGGYVNTELRELESTLIFQYCDYITLDQGELPLLRIIEHLKDEKNLDSLVRTYTCIENEVQYWPGTEKDVVPFADSGFPDYEDLDLHEYLSIMELTNPMHRLWNDGKWNKMMVAQGCYWQKCSFCDTSLSYIKDYDTVGAETLVNRIEQLIAQTGLTGFHFVDEAAPPSVLKNLAIELLNRNINISWWTNIRFEKNYTPDLCRLLAKSGCIAVSGGLETVSDRLLDLMNKGVNLDKAVSVLSSFNRAGIMVHAYLMYGFPTQTEQETIDALEIVRQLFENSLIQSCFWHRFSLTAHSAIARNPKAYQVKITGSEKGTFAWNDLYHQDPKGCEHGDYANGLEKAVYNFMHGIGIEYNVASWFDFRTVPSTISPEFVSLLTKSTPKTSKAKEHHQVLWLGDKPQLLIPHPGRSKKNRTASCKLIINGDHSDISIKSDEQQCRWILEILDSATPASGVLLTVKQVAAAYEQKFDQSFELLKNSSQWQKLERNGLIYI